MTSTTLVDQPKSQMELEAKLRRYPLSVAASPFSYDAESIRANDHPLSDYSLKRLSTMLGIPGGFLPKCSPGLSTKILQEFIGKTERPISILATEQGEVASFVWSDYLYIPVEKVVSAIEAGLPDLGFSVKKDRPGIDSFSIFLAEAGAFEVIGTDEIYFGVAFRSSMDGSSSTRIILSFFRPTCINGAYLPEATWSLPRRALKTVDAAELAIAEGAQNIFSMRGAWNKNTRILAAQEVGDPLDEIRRVAQGFGISPTALDYLNEAYSAEPVSTLWGIVNAFTRAANTVPSFSLAEQLWTSAGIVVQEASVRCKTCGSNLLNGTHSH